MIVPGQEDRADGAPQLLQNILGKILPGRLAHDAFVRAHKLTKVLRGNLRIAPGADSIAKGEELVLELLPFDIQDDVGVHLNEAPIGIQGESFVIRRFGQSLHSLVVEAEIEDRVHHAGHGSARAGAH